LFENNSPLDYTTSELSQSHNALDYEKEKEREQEFVVRDKKMTATTADLSTVGDDGLYVMKNLRKRPEASYHYKLRGEKKAVRKSYSAEGLKSQLPKVPENESKQEAKHGKSEPCLTQKTQHSVENLSEDSGFGDHISNNKKVLNFRSSVSSIPEDEDSSPPESSSSYYSDCSEEGSSVVSSEGRADVNKKDEILKINERKEPEVRGCLTVKNDDVDVNFNPSQSQTHMYAWETGGIKQEALIATSVEFASPHSDIRPRPEFKTFFGNKSCEDLKIGKLSAFKEPENEMNEDKFRQMAARLPVVSTLNLFLTDEDFVRNVPSAASSLTHVPLKLGDDDLNLRNGLSGSGKGVHFCPVVSEVSWRDSYSEDSSSDDSSDPSTDEMSNRSLEDLCMENDDEDFEIEEKLIPRDEHSYPRDLNSSNSLLFYYLSRHCFVLRVSLRNFAPLCQCPNRSPITR